MRRLTADTFEEVGRALSSRRPVNVKQIDFRNPYFTQPRTAPTETAAAMYAALAGAPVRHVYVHVPFCATRCTYCHYPTVTNVHSEENQTRLLEGIRVEIDQARAAFDLSNVLTVHVGGGTPNCLSERNIEILARLLAEEYSPTQEFAFELYPSSELTPGKIQALCDHGVNRLSIGVQTFDDEVNDRNQRIGQPASTVRAAVELAKRRCDNVSIDLLYGQKGQTIATLERDCAVAMDLAVNSVYLYQTRELLHTKGVELQLALNLFLHLFTEGGYEIVSFDQVIRKRNSDGFCAHRSGRSLSENLLGIGPGAVSEIDYFICRNVDPETYAREGPGVATNGIVRKSDRTVRAEYLNRSLRHYNYPEINGTWASTYAQRFGRAAIDDFGDELGCLEELGLVRCDEDRIEVTEMGMHFTQQINYYLLGHYK